MKNRKISLLFVCLLILILFGINGPVYAFDAQILQNEAGFITITPVKFYFHQGSYFNRLPLLSSEARIWYSFHVADQNPNHKPLFVFFNGGPGAASTSGLMSMYTTRVTLDNSIDGGGNQYIPNPHKWTGMGNLLYIDARQTGFSYNVMRDPVDWRDRFKEFNAQNFNPFFDAADYIRVILRLLAAHPELQKNPVVIVGESYGGTRSLVMLHLLLNYRSYKNGQEVYQDESLVDEIQDHFDVVFPEYAGQEVPPEVIAQQFGHQILIQPAVSSGYQREVSYEMWAQEGSVIDQIGKEVGIPYDPNSHGSYYDYVENVAGRDVYMYTKPKDWLNSFFDKAGVLLRHPDQLENITGVRVTDISLLYASRRAQAYRIYDTSHSYSTEPSDGTLEDLLFKAYARREASLYPQEPGYMEQVFGRLYPWDRYFLGLNYESNLSFHWFNVALFQGYDIHFRDVRFGRMFLKDVAHVHTFITNAALDLVIYSRAVPGALAKHEDILESVRHETTQPGDQARPGQIILKYRPGAFPDIPNLDSRTIRFPIYAQSCHAVSLTQPENFLHDVRQWLSQHGINIQDK